MLRIVSLIILALTSITGMGKNDKPAYGIFTEKGKPTGYSKLLKAAADADIVLFGELHDNPICHWLEAELLKDIYALKREKLVVGAEMFEADNQNALDSFLRSQLNDKDFAKTARLWPNYDTDYKPLTEFARDNKIPFVATNIPRRFASKVYKKGFAALDSLKDYEKSWVAPLPIMYDSSLFCYREIVKAAGGHGGPNLPLSQASKDATMAWFILKNHKKGQTFLHYNGTYHSENFQSIVWYLMQQNPELKIVTISSVMQETVYKLLPSNSGKGNFIIAVPERMTRTY